MGLGANIAIFAVARSLTTAPALRTLVAAGVLVLALTCANAISLLLARMTREHRRLFIRIALGAERSHLIRQALAEGAALSGIALGGGLTCALALVRAAALLAPEGVPRVSQASLAAPAVVVYAVTAGVTVALLCGAVPLLLVLRRTRIERLTEAVTNARTTTLPMRYGLIVAQTALAVVLLITAVLTVRSFHAVRQVRLGFDASDLVTVDVFAPLGSTTRPSSISGSINARSNVCGSSPATSPVFTSVRLNTARSARAWRWCSMAKTRATRMPGASTLR